jgi:hypothetical protein
MWLRKLPPEAFTDALPKLPDGELFCRRIANHFPHSRKLASIWLRALADVAELGHEPAAVWIAREIVRGQPRVMPARLRLISLWSWYSIQPTTVGHALMEKPWTPQMRLGSAIAAADDWKERISLEINLGAQPIGDMWLRPGNMAGYDFLPLDSVAAIAEEATAMRNCLRRFGTRLAHNWRRLWSVRQNGQRIATLSVGVQRLNPLPAVVELRGPGNAPVSRELWWVAQQWLQTHDLARIETCELDYGAAALDRPTWLRLWRPYWLAKRRIPDWLPIAPSRDALEAL